MAAAPVPAAEGSAAGGQRCGPRPPARHGALLRRLGPHAPDCGALQDAPGPVLPHHRGTAARGSQKGQRVDLWLHAVFL